MLQSQKRRSDHCDEIRKQIESGILPKRKTLEQILEALRLTKKHNVLEVFGFLSAKVKRRNSVDDLGLVSCRLVTAAFANYLVDSMQDSTTYPMDVFKWHGSGTGTTAEENTQTALTTEVEDRAEGTLIEGASANIYKSVGTQTYTDTRAIKEHGLFSADAAGTMLDRSLIATAINVESTDEIEWTYQLTVSAES